MNPETIITLIQLGISVFEQVFTLFTTKGVPVTQAPAIQNHLNATPGMTPDHVTVINSAVNTAAAVATATGTK